MNVDLAGFGQAVLDLLAKERGPVPTTVGFAMGDAEPAPEATILYRIRLWPDQDGDAPSAPAERPPAPAGATQAPDPVRRPAQDLLTRCSAVLAAQEVET